MPDNERSPIIRGVIFAVILLIAVLAAALTTQAATARSRAAVLKAMRLERSLGALLSSVQDAETGQRGFLLTGDESYLEPFSASLRVTPTTLKALDDFIEPGRNRNRFHRLSQLIRSKYDELDETIRLRRAGDTAGALALVKEDLGKLLMDSIRGEILLLKQAEQAEVDANVAVVQSLFNLDLVLRIIIFAGMFGLLYYLYSRLRPLMTELENTVAEKDVEIANRRKAESKNVRLISDLKNKNEDLDHFAYIASHDLQEPLRTVTNFIEIVEEDYGDVVGEEGKVYFGFINDATERMRRLIETLLNYSQLGRGSELQRVDLNTIIADVQLQLAGMIEDSGAEISVGQLPSFTAYPVEITQVFQNLISNAIKFVAPGERPVIKIFQDREGTSSFRIAVKDKGIGMNQAALSKIFQMFSRINEAGSFAGHGIGLAFCRKIVEMHGGTITAESSPGEGTIFYLTLPKNLTPPPNETKIKPNSADR